jgi:hypothetical protein
VQRRPNFGCLAKHVDVPTLWVTVQFGVLLRTAHTAYRLEDHDLLDRLTGRSNSARIQKYPNDRHSPTTKIATKEFRAVTLVGASNKAVYQLDSFSKIISALRPAGYLLDLRCPTGESISTRTSQYNHLTTKSSPMSG